MEVYYSGEISGSFDGFNEGKIFKLDDGSYWIQTEYEYDYMYELAPEATILESDGTYYLLVCGKKVEVEQIFDVTESRIEGEFRGWDKDKIYKLANGDIWQQASYHYEYKYANNPEVMVYTYNGTTFMQVDGTKCEVKKLAPTQSSSNNNYGGAGSLPFITLGDLSKAILHDEYHQDTEEEKPTVSPKKDSKKKSNWLGIVVGVLLILIIFSGLRSLCISKSRDKAERASHPNEVKLPHSAEYYKDKNYYDVTIELMELGLSDIQLIPMDDQKSGFLSSAGDIESIKIGEYYDFQSDLWVDENSQVN